MTNVVEVDFAARKVISPECGWIRPMPRLAELSDFLGVEGWSTCKGVLFAHEGGWWWIDEPKPGYLRKIGVDLTVEGVGDAQIAEHAAAAIAEALEQGVALGVVDAGEEHELRLYWADKADDMAMDVFRQVVMREPVEPGEVLGPKLLVFHGDLGQSVRLAVEAYQVAIQSFNRSASPDDFATFMASQLAGNGFDRVSAQFWISAAFPAADHDIAVEDGFRIAEIEAHEIAEVTIEEDFEIPPPPPRSPIRFV